jgi:hypothetical protein
LLDAMLDWLERQRVEFTDDFHEVVGSTTLPEERKFRSAPIGGHRAFIAMRTKNARFCTNAAERDTADCDNLKPCKKAYRPSSNSFDLRLKNDGPPCYAKNPLYRRLPLRSCSPKC